MEEIVNYLEPKLLLCNESIIKKNLCRDFSVSRRGCCGLINIDNLLPFLIADLKLEKIDILSPYNEQLYDIYYSSINNFYIKRLCICDVNCLSKCGKNKNKKNCDGHHVIIVSLTNSLAIDEINDYVIDFTYKQMIYSADEEITNMDAITKMKDYLFLPFLHYINFSKTERWKKNITEPCKMIINNENDVESKYKVKYFKYKNKYLALKAKNL